MRGVPRAILFGHPDRAKQSALSRFLREAKPNREVPRGQVGPHKVTTGRLNQPIRPTDA
jgi:hypothetical protein